MRDEDIQIYHMNTTNQRQRDRDLIYFHLTPRELHAHARRGRFWKISRYRGNTETLPEDIIILLFRARARADKREGVRQMTTGAAVMVAAEGKQLRGGICRAYSNRRQIKSASVHCARCGEHDEILLFLSPHQLCAPRILDVESREDHPLISIWRHYRAHLGTVAVSKLLKAITVLSV